MRYRWLGWEDHSFAGTGLTTTITGLEPGVRYDAEVRATNADGTGPWSDAGAIHLPECVTDLGTITGTVDFADERSTWVLGCTTPRRNTLARYFTFQVDRDVSVYMTGDSWPSLVHLSAGWRRCFGCSDRPRRRRLLFVRRANNPQPQRQHNLHVGLLRSM